jgi:hypothetical protein
MSMVRPLLSIALVSLLAVSFGCSTTVKPRVTVVTPISEFGEGKIFLKSNREEARIAESFRSAGLQIVSAPYGADLVLNVRMGSKRGGGACGPVHNMQAELMQGTWTILRIVARGPTGHCAHSAVDQMATEIKSFLDANQQRKPGPAPPPAPVKLPEPEVSEPVKTGEPPAPRAPRPQLGGAD